MSLLPLGPARLGAVAVVDDADFEWLSQWRWTVIPSGYAARWTRPDANGSRHVILMHRELCQGGPTVDHINGNRLDNRRSNLRPATHADQSRNTAKRRDGLTSRFKGVSFDARPRPLARRWAAAIHINGIHFGLGRFATEDEAAAAYADAAREAFGDFARPASR